MRLTRLEVTHLRIIESAAMDPGPGMNLIHGANGSGKTSLLEAIHLLCTGHSFRSRRAEEFIARGAGETVVFARASEREREEEPLTVGVEKRPRATRIRLSGESVRNASALARALPVVVVPPDSQRLVFDGAGLRRRLLDWGLFHVEHEYAAAHQDYRRVLKQRNAQLRSEAGAGALESWNAELDSAGARLHQLRTRHLERMLPRVANLTSSLSCLKVSIHYKPGWDTSVPLALALKAVQGRDRARGYTGIGPHRADLELKVGEQPAAQVISRGEAKLICFSLWLAQARDHQAEMGRTPLILIDDLAAELDGSNRSRVLAALAALDAQSFVTSVSRDLAGTLPAGFKRFHVERGKLAEMV